MIAEGVFRVLKRDRYDEGSPDREPVTWRSGAPIEYADLYDEGEGVVRRCTIAETLEGKLPAPGSLVTARIRVALGRKSNGEPKIGLRLLAVAAPNAA